MSSLTDYGKIAKNIRTELKNYITSHGIKSLILGVSGGADSTLIALLAKPICDELKVPLISASITIESNKPSEISRAEAVGENFCTDFTHENFTDEFRTVSLMCEYDKDNLSTEDKIRKGNIKARLRMIYLYNLASMNKGMVMSTDNYTELLLGFWTLHGDVGDYGMIQNLWKSEVYALLEYLRDHEAVGKTEYDVINDVIQADATDGLGITNTDLDQILPGWEGSSKDGYTKVDSHLQDPQLYNDSPAVDRMNRTEFKRLNPVNIPRETILFKTMKSF